MAPIQSEQSHSLYTSSSAVKPFSCSFRGALSDGWEWFLPIARRGHFFQDSFFENARSQFDAAVREVLRRWSDTSLMSDCLHDTPNHFSRYRQLRSHNLNEENQAITVSSDNNSLKILLDAHDFMEGDVKVKVIGEKEVVVKGYVENRKEGENTVSSQKFSRRFLIPADINVEGITSVMSSDGILIITAPKKNGANVREEGRTIFHKEATSNNASQKSKTATQTVHETVDSSSNSKETQDATSNVKYCENCYTKPIIGKEIDEKSNLHEETRIPIQNYSTLQQNITKSHNTSYSQQNQIESSKEENLGSSISGQANTKKSSENNTLSSEVAEENNLVRSIPVSVNVSSLPIIKRGLFFNDSIFEHFRNDFQSAVREILSSCGERSSLMDDLTCYRNLRTRDLQEENQAVKISEDESSHKFVLDVHDFMNGGEVNVKTINDREIVVEGHLERQEGCAKSVKRFFKRFTVPGDIRLDSLLSVMSSDGVLTITAPKKLSLMQIKDVVSPRRTEEVHAVSSERFESDVKNAKLSHGNSTQETCELSSKLLNTTASSDAHQVSLTNHRMTANEYVIPVHVEGIAKEVKLDKTSQFMKKSDDIEKSVEKMMTENSESSGTRNISSSQHKTESNSKQNIREIEIKQNNTIAESEQHDHSSGTLSSSSGRILPLIKKDSFSTDSYFEGFRQNFERAVRDVLLKFSENNHSDDLKAYRRLRHCNLTSENQAFNVYEDEKHHKVVVDARDFIDGDITISIVDERELVIEGRTENKKDALSSFLSFCRRILLPDSVNINAITSAISSDGILTVESVKSNASSCLNNTKKISSEAHSKKESHDNSGHNWEEKSLKESSEQSEGYSSRTLCSRYSSCQKYSTANTF